MKHDADIIIRNATVITVDPERRIITDGAVIIQKDRIKDIGKTPDLTDKYTAPKVVDGSDKLIMPGLINTHLHFFEWMCKGLVPENLDAARFANFHQGKVGPFLKPEDEVYGGLGALIETLKSGTTTVLEDGSLNPDEVIEGVASLGMRVSVARRVFDQVIMGHSTMAKSTDECIRLNEDFVRKYRNGLADGRVTPHVAVVGMGRVTPTLFVECKKLADQYKVVMNAHTAPTLGVVHDSLLRTGMRPVEHLAHLGVLGRNLVLVHMIHVNDGEIHMLQESETSVSFCPTTGLKLLHGISAFGRFPEMLHAGVNVCLASDAPAAGNFSDMIRVMYLAAVLFKDARHDATVIPAETAIEMATIFGAKALGMEKEIGSLEVGKKADLIIIDMGGVDWYPPYDPIQNLVYSSAGNSVQTVIIDGKIVMENRQISTVDEDKVLAKIRGLSRGLLERSGVSSINTRWKVV